MCVLSLGFNSGIYDKTIWAGESKFCAIFFSPNSCPAGNKLGKKVAQKSDFTA